MTTVAAPSSEADLAAPGVGGIPFPGSDALPVTTNVADIRALVNPRTVSSLVGTNEQLTTLFGVVAE